MGPRAASLLPAQGVGRRRPPARRHLQKGLCSLCAPLARRRLTLSRTRSSSTSCLGPVSVPIFSGGDMDAIPIRVAHHGRGTNKITFPRPAWARRGSGREAGWTGSCWQAAPLPRSMHSIRLPSQGWAVSRFRSRDVAACRFLGDEFPALVSNRDCHRNDQKEEPRQDPPLLSWGCLVSMPLMGGVKARCRQAKGT